MIQLHSLIIALLSCWVSANSQFTIDWKLCREEMECFVLNECVDANSVPDNKDLEDYSGSKPLLISECRVGLQKRFFTKEKILYIIQIRRQQQAATTESIQLLHGDAPILICKVEAGEVIVKASSPSYESLNPKLYEDFSRFDNDLIVCAFTVEQISTLDSLDVPGTAHSKIMFNDVPYMRILPGSKIFKSNDDKVRCDPDSIKNVDEMNGFYVRPLRYKDRMSLDCSYYKSEKGLSYELHIHQSKGDPNVTSELKCVGNKYKFNNVELSDFSAFCALPVSRTCVDPELSCNGPLCPVFSPGDNTKDADMKCKGDRWIINGQKYEGIQSKCRTNTENKPVFFISYPDNDDVELKSPSTAVQCFENYDCLEKSQLVIFDCEQNVTTCGEVDMGEDKMHIKCKNDADQLVIIGSDEIERNDTWKLTCNANNGMYFNETNNFTVPITSRIKCVREVQHATSEMFSDGALAGISIGFVFAAIILVLALFACCFFLFTRRKRIRPKRTPASQGWKKMSSPERIAKAQDIFRKASLIRPGQDILLITALKLLDEILECETEESQVWTAIDPFLRRFQSVAFDKSRPIEQMFNRYCYLRARKIIDKYGWLSEKRITNADESGFIRVYAIRLLAFARRGEVDAQKMILDGFKKLQFNAVDQYPHCGLLWALLTQQRVGSIPLQEKLIAILRHISKTTTTYEVPKADIIPQFGSINNQVCFAYGAADVCDSNITKVDDILSKRSISSARSILEGILDCMSGNSSITLFVGFLIAPKGGPMQEWQKALFQELFPSRLILEKAMTTMVFQRRFGDAKTLEKKFDVIERDPPQLVEGQVDVYKKKDIIKEKDIKKKDIIKKEEKEESTNEIYFKLRESHRQFIDSFNDETAAILDWLTLKVEMNEVKKLVKSERKEAEKTSTSRSSSQSNPIQDKMNTNDGMKSEPEEKTAVDDNDFSSFVDEFVNSFYKEWNVTRITSCTLNETEQNKYRAILMKMMEKETVYGMRLHLAVEDVASICDKATDIVMTEPVCIEDVPAGICVVADLHGQLFDLVRLFEANSIDGKPGYECAKYLFTGDYVDRGDQGLEVVVTLFILKILYPDRFWLLRGNHETIHCNCSYGFLDEMTNRYCETAGEYLYDKVNETFMYLSICAIVGGKIFCSHGGVSPGSFNRHELRLVRKPIASSNSDSLIQDILWSDPACGPEGGFMFAPGRGCASLIGDGIMRSALERIDCKAMIRGHTVLQDGYEIVSPRCLAIFGATGQDDRCNDAAFVRIAEDLTCQICVLECNIERNALEIALFGDKEKDVPTAFYQEDRENSPITREDLGEGRIMNIMKEE